MVVFIHCVYKLMVTSLDAVPSQLYTQVFLFILRKKKSDGFIGRLFYPLRSIPHSGEGRVLIIYDRPGKKEFGSVTLWFSIGVKEKRAPIAVRQAL